jgi:hypothetical protein
MLNTSDVCCVIPTKLAEIEEKITAMEATLMELQSSSIEISDWIRAGKLSIKIAGKSFSIIGCLFNWCVKVCIALTMLYAALKAFAISHLSIFDFFFSNK